jgi:hypothetical protein
MRSSSTRQIVVAVAAISEWNAWAFHTVPGPKWLTTALPLLLALPLLWRRSRPLLAASLVIAGMVVQAVATGNSAEGLELIIAAGVAAYSVAAYSDRRRALVGLAVLAVGYTIYAFEDRNIQSGRTKRSLGRSLLRRRAARCLARRHLRP